MGSSLKALYSAVKSMEEYKRGDDISSINDILSEKLRWTFQVNRYALDEVPIQMRDIKDFDIL